MPVTITQTNGASVGMLPAVFNELNCADVVSEIKARVEKGSKFVADGSQMMSLDQQGLRCLMELQRWTSSAQRRKLAMVGLSAEVWKTVVDSGADFCFDNFGSVSEALKAVGATEAEAADVPPPFPKDFVPAAPPPLRPQVAAEEAWTKISHSEPPATRAHAPVPLHKSGPATDLDDSGWRTDAGPKSRTGQSAKRNFPWVMLILAVAIVAGGVGAWWFLAHRGPELTISSREIVAEEQGKEVEDVEVEVTRGHLREDSWQEQLPKGLYFEESWRKDGDSSYMLRGNAEAGAQSRTVRLVAENDAGKVSEPVIFTVTVEGRPMAWQLNTLQSLPLKAGEAIKGKSTFLVGAESVRAGGEFPAELKIELVPGTTAEWQLSGTPATAGMRAVQLTATSPSGISEERSCTLEIQPADANSPAESKPIPQDAAQTPNPAPVPVPIPTKPVPAPADTPAPSQAAVPDDGMRNFLLERIEKLPARYTEEDRENLRLVVKGLKKSRMICRVLFEKDGQVEISNAQSDTFEAALKDPINADVLRDPKCQIMVVGYASKTGSIAANVRISKLRAKAVEGILQTSLGRKADLCGDYGPTDVVDKTSEHTNRSVEVYAGTLEIPDILVPRAENFKRDFNRRHGSN